MKETWTIMNDETKYDFTKQIGFLLRRAYQRHMAIFQQTVPESRLTAAQFVVLLTVRDHGPCEFPVVVQHTALDDASARGIVERLKWRKLLSTEHEPGDARRIVVSLTPEGQEILDQTVPFAQEITELTYGDLTAQERATLVALLHKMDGTDD
jgi:DNA-binding MarR family transcriptional regulator